MLLGALFILPNFGTGKAGERAQCLKPVNRVQGGTTSQEPAQREAASQNKDGNDSKNKETREDKAASLSVYSVSCPLKADRTNVERFLEWPEISPVTLDIKSLC